MGVLDENIYEIKNASKKELDDFMNQIYEMIKPRTRPLEEKTGISCNSYIKGFPWSRVKVRAMMDGADDNFVIVSYFCSLIFCID